MNERMSLSITVLSLVSQLGVNWKTSLKNAFMFHIIYYFFYTFTKTWRFAPCSICLTFYFRRATKNEAFITDVIYEIWIHRIFSNDTPVL